MKDTTKFLCGFFVGIIILCACAAYYGMYVTLHDDNSPKLYRGSVGIQETEVSSEAEAHRFVARQVTPFLNHFRESGVITRNSVSRGLSGLSRTEQLKVAERAKSLHVSLRKLSIDSWGNFTKEKDDLALLEIFILAEMPQSQYKVA